MNQAQRNFEKIHQLSRHATVLESINSLLGWDQETYMPPAASEFRAEQIKTLAGLIHKEKTGKAFQNLLGSLIDLETGASLTKDLDEAQASAVKEWHRQYSRQCALPTTFVEDFAKVTSKGVEVWREARAAKDFSLFQPLLEKIVAMSQQKCELIGYQEHPYDALLEDYEPGMTTAKVEQLFCTMQKPISALVKSIASCKQVQDDFLYSHFSKEEQIAFSKQLLETMGFSFNTIRLDFSTHPFSCTMHPTDSRITTRMRTHDSITRNIMTVLHEGGHSLYGTGVPHERFGSPLGEPVSMAVDESQSRWWETRIGLSKHFWVHFYPLLQKHFPEQFSKVPLEDFYKAINKVAATPIRVDADEVTYPLHVILRFEIEKALIEGSLKVKDIPDAWNSKMGNLLGIIPQDSGEGCLQDIHWAIGALGYFPSYALGNMYASHFFQAFEKEHTDWKPRVENGELIFIKSWLNHHIFQHGKRYNSGQLLKRVTGKTFSADAYIEYLTQKYRDIYPL